ncbi:low-density lipoprotein receptor-related protein 6-like [Mercenaria mercenaria]|uniref:low-density lipoprotein receptor-related protein 6-like n=1 Tax=Mercenaria mercenaria TaxID=6596 RepID=UPI00234F009F|nr:low-density lipoprotein receptor-related protein 6-like [Mercenaria mercenaria]
MLVLDFDVEFRSKEFYMYEYRQSSIIVGSGYNKDLNFTDSKFNSLHVGVSKGTVQLAVDWLSHTVYWNDPLFRWIVAVPGGKQKLDKDYYKIIVDDHLDGPSGIALDPLKGYLFWSDSGRHPKIERSDLKGNNRHTLITKHLVSPLSMEADIFGKRIYWTDTYTHSLLSATYNGKDMRMIASVPNSVLFDLAIYKDVVYVTDIRNANLYTFNKTTGRLEVTVKLSTPGQEIFGVTVYGEHNQPLKDTDYCGNENCEQLCISEENNATCICSEGYEKNATTGACQDSYAEFHKAIVIANATHICMLDIRYFANSTYDVVCRYTVIGPLTSTVAPDSSTQPAPTASPNELIKKFDLDISNRMVIFATADNKIYKRPADLPIENDAKELIIQASGNISGMAYDTYYSENLYWSESDTGNIWLVDVDTKTVKRISIENSVTLVNPRDTILLPTLRRLAWVEGNQGDVSLQTMTIDGMDRRTVVSGLSEITSLVYDNEARLFYFLSNGTLHRTTLNGSEQISSVEDQKAYLLVQYKKYLAWIYIHPLYGNIWNSIYNGATQNNHTFNTTSPFVDMKVLDIKPYLPETASPCAYMNGGCEQICIPKYTGDMMVKVCECSIGFKLDPDKVSCRSDVVKDNFILVSDWTHNALRQIDLQTNEINSIMNREHTAYMGVYFDSNSKRIIWSEYFRSEIFSSELDGSDQKIIGDLGNSFPYRMDKDLTTGNLYYTTTSHSHSHIGLLTPSGVNIWLKRDITKETLGDIVVHPGKGWMFYIVLHAISYIARANMDGTNELKIIVGDNVTNPDGLAIDFTRDHLYWSDATHDTIQRCNLDGEECLTIVNETDSRKQEEIKDLVTDGTYLYYSAYRNDHVVRINLTKPDIRTIIAQSPGLGKIDTMALHRSSDMNIQPVNQACRARGGLGDCSSICLPTNTGKRCACRGNMPLKLDDRTCSNIYQCSDVIRQEAQTATGRENINIVIEKDCHRHLNDTCKYRCPTFYGHDIKVIKGTTTVTCTNVGWDKEMAPLCKELVCSDSSLTNGNIVGNCSRRIYDTCTYKCEQGYTGKTDVVFCNRNMKWTPHEPCTVTTTLAQEQKGLPVAGVTIGIVFLVLVIIALVIVIVYLVRRGVSQYSASANYGYKAKFHKGQDGSIAIENPAYLPSDTPTTGERDEHPYSTVDSRRGGYETLQEEAHVEVTRDV